MSLVQKDMKKLVAYSSVSHLGFVMLGMFALNPMGLNGAVLQMINHGISTGALFLLVGIIYERRHTRMIAEYGGLGEADADVRDALPDRRAVVDGPAGAQRLHRRVHDPARRREPLHGLGALRRASASSSAPRTCCGSTSASSGVRSTTPRTRRCSTSTAASSALLLAAGRDHGRGSESSPAVFFDMIEEPVNYVVRKVDPTYFDKRPIEYPPAAPVVVSAVGDHAMTWNDFIYLLPEILLTIGASALLLVPVIGARGTSSPRSGRCWSSSSLTAGSLIACSHAVEAIDQSRQLQAMFALDGFSIFFKLLFIAAIGMLVLLSDDFLARVALLAVGVLLAARLRRSAA